MTVRICLAGLCLTSAFLSSWTWVTAAEKSSGPLCPEKSVQRLEPAPGLEISLFAHEPMVVNPTNIDIDARGRVWVTEGVNYRRFQDLKPAGDRIVILEDTDGNGRADRDTVFYQDASINAALGLAVLGTRVIVSCSPNVFVFTDADGDDFPERKDLLFTGLEGVQHDHGVHAFVFGPDGKLYFNFGNLGRKLLDANGRPIKDLAGNTIDASGNPYRQGMVFRCNLDGSEIETLGHNFRNSYEVAIDAFGNLWQSDNDDDGNRSTRINFVMEFGNYGYRDELTGAGWKNQSRTGQHPEVPLRHFHQNDPGVVPNLIQTGAGSPTGICVYEGDLLPKEYRGQLLHCDAGPNVVRAYRVTPSGGGYRGEILPFVKGYDPWFRPSDICVAADGSIFIADWYDAGVGGHHMEDQDPSTMRGRIYRVAPPRHQRVVPSLDLASAAKACEALDSPNQARRFGAWTALHEMGAEAETELVNLWHSNDARARARALQLLARIKGRHGDYLGQAIRDSNPRVRITALRIARSLRLDLVPILKVLVNDQNRGVRRECAIALRHQPSDVAPELWAALAVQHDGKDRWYLEALGIGADRQEASYFAAWRAEVGEAWNNPAGRDIIWRSRAADSLPFLAQIVRGELPEGDNRLRYMRAFDFHSGVVKRNVLLSLLDADDPIVASEALARCEGLDPKNNALHRTVVQKVLDGGRGTEQFVDLIERFQLPGHTADVYDVVLKNATSSAGARAVRWLFDNEGAFLLEDGVEDKRDAIAIQVIHAIGNSNDKRMVRLLTPVVVDEDRSEAVRGRAARSLMRSRNGAAALLQQARVGRIGDEIKPLVGWLLSNALWRDIREGAADALPPPALKEGQTLPSIAELISRKGSSNRGRAVYEKSCANCHRAGTVGKDFGPELTEIGDKLGRDALFSSVLDPNAGISFDHEGVLLSVNTGDQVVGIVESETADEVTLKTPGGIVTKFAKSDILVRQRLNRSIMPTGLQASMSTQELVDLIEFLSALRAAR